MKAKKEARKLAGITGNGTNKDTKRKRICQYKLVSKWHTPAGVLTWERRAK